MASSSSSDFSSGEITTPPRKRKGTPLIMLVPLIYAPVLPLIRIGFRRNPVLRDRLFYGVLAGAFAHGTYLILTAIVQSSFFMLPNVSHTKMWYYESTTSAGLKLRLQQWLLSHFIDKDDEEFV